MTDNTVSEIAIQFSDQSLVLLNICLGFIMFGIALGIDPKDFKLVAKRPKSTAVGVISQFLLLPAATFLIVWIMQPAPALALGMILVASCPGGNISNFISSISGANVALSVSLTGLATLITPLFTPLNFEFWAHSLADTSLYLQSFHLEFIDILKTVVLLLVIPLLLGLWVRNKFRALSQKIEKPIRILSLIILVGFIAVALANNFSTFIDYLYIVFLLVLVHNGVAFAIGYFAGKAARLPEADRRTVSIETGIQNSGLGLIIIFTFFDGNGGMAIIAAWWGIWHIVAGLLLAYYFKYRDRRAGIQKPIQS
ncbi:bile acid:sodium symporter family protein [Cryomorpha ignava]|nr:bile acid:sodium symporter family protein [Cryomorpha ignava]